jgi:hypothetical protein
MIVQKILGNPEHIGIVKHGIPAIRKWRKAHPRTSLDLRGGDFLGIKLNSGDLSGAKFGAARPDERPAILRDAKLRNAQFQRSYMRMVDLRGADLRGADFSRSQLSLVDFGFADLREANLRDCIFIATDFHGANLSGACIAGSIVGHTHFTSLDLSKVKGISELQHEYPSFISIETLLRSPEPLPEIFLRGCGVPDALIAVLPQLSKSMDPIQFDSCFISFSYSDRAFATRLHSRLGSAGVRVWFSPKDMRGGKRLFDQIDRAIQSHDLLLLILSKKSMRSDWVTTEIRRALAAEAKTKRRKIFPIRLCDMESLRSWTCFDADTGKDMAVQIREYFIPDFSRWINKSDFEDGVGRLLEDLRSNA